CRFRKAVFDSADIVHTDRGAVRVSDDDVAELTRRIDSAQRPDRNFVRTPNNAASRNLDILTLDGLLELSDRDAVCIHLLGIGEDTYLPRTRAGQVDGAHTVNGFEYSLDLFVGNLGRLAKAFVAGDDERHYGFRIRIRFLNNWWESIRRKVLHGSRDFLSDI